MLVPFVSNGADYMWLIIVPFPAVVALLFAVFRSYKKNCFNMVDCSGFSYLALSAFLIIRVNHITLQLFYVLMLIPFLYFVFFSLLINSFPMWDHFALAVEGLGKYLKQEIQFKASTCPPQAVTTEMKIFQTGL